MRAVIVGGGIGGLSAAIALRLRRWDVTLLEQAPALTEVGAGLQISPNGWRVLEAMGVARLLVDTVFEPERIEMRWGTTGRRIFDLAMRHYARRRWGAPYMQIHRADLVQALSVRITELAPDALQNGHVVTGYNQTATEAMVRTQNGGAFAGDLVIGADGLHSVLRKQMLGPDEPRYTGNAAWRAVVPMDALGNHAPPPSACVWVGDKRHAVTTQLRAGRLANFVGMVETPEPAEEDWRSTGTRADALADFADWHPTITTLIEQAEVLHRWALFDRAPLPRWHEGSVALLGDAAHPMLPSMAQGAVQAMEDAWTLAGLQEQGATVEEGLARYYAQRIARTASIQQGSVRNARMFHQASPAMGPVFYGAMTLGARFLPELVHRRQDWVYRHDVTADVPPL